MDRLPVRPTIFLCVYWALILGAFAPGLWLNGGFPHLWLRSFFVWFFTLSFAASAWQAVWTWQVLRFASNRRPASDPTPSRMRTVKRLAIVLAPVFLACFVMQLKAVPHSGAVVSSFMVPLLLIAFLTVARAVCEAEEAVDRDARPGVFGTLLQLVYAPLCAVYLYRRLENLGPPSARPQALPA